MRTRTEELEEELSIARQKCHDTEQEASQNISSGCLTFCKPRLFNIISVAFHVVSWALNEC